MYIYCIQVNIIYFKYIISLYIRKYIITSPQALNLIEYIKLYILNLIEF